MKALDAFKLAAALNGLSAELSGVLIASDQLSASIRMMKVADSRKVTWAESEFYEAWTLFKTGLELKTGEKLEQTIRKLRE